MKFIIVFFIVVAVSVLSIQNLSFAEDDGSVVQEEKIDVMNPPLISAEATMSLIEAMITVGRIKSEFVVRLAEDYETFSGEGKIKILGIIAEMGEQKRFNEILYSDE